MNKQTAGSLGVLVRPGVAWLALLGMVAALLSPQVARAACHNPNSAEDGSNDGNCSLIDNLMFEHYHFATDYQTQVPERTSGCTSCASAPQGPDGAEKGTELPGLVLKRTHRPRVFYQHGAFGPGIFSNFDAQLTVERSPEGQVVRLFEPENASLDGTVFVTQNPLNGQSTPGKLWPQNGQKYRFKSLSFLGAEGESTADLEEGGEAIALLPNGSKWFFEIIRTRASNDYQLMGRLVREEDRRGNAIVISYKFGVFATDPQLGNDRDKLWQMDRVTDAYARSMTFSYVLQGEWGSWVVSRVDLPNGQAVRYEYGVQNILPLARVIYPDGTLSTFEHGDDEGLQQHAVRYDDAGAEPTHRRKTLYFSQDQYIDASGEWVPQVPYLIRRAFNGNGELMYMNQEDAANPDEVSYAYMAHKGYARVQQSGDDFVSEEFATNWTLGGDPATFTYEPKKKGLLTAYLKSGTRIDGLGRQTQLEYDLDSGEISKTTYPDGTLETTTYNVFAEPLRKTSRTGRITDFTYDAKGNLLTETRGVGTSAASTWRFEYNSRGQVTRALDPNYLAATPELHVMSYVYDSRGFLIQKIESGDVAGAARPTSSYVWDAAGRLTQSTGPSGQMLSHTFDPRNRLVSTTFGDGSTESKTYGSGVDANLLIQETDRNGHATRYGYDASDRRISTTRAYGRPEAVVSTCTFLTGTKFPERCVDRGNAMKYGYDKRQRRVSETEHPNTGIVLTTITKFNANSFPVFEEDPYGRAKLYGYDVNDRVTRTVREAVPASVARNAVLSTLARVTTPNPSYVIEDTGFNADGDVVSRADGRGTVKGMEYDAQRRLTAEVVALGTALAARTEYSYDKAGNRTRERRPRAFTESGTFDSIFTYTGRNLLQSVTEGSGSSSAATKTLTYTPSQKLATETDFRGHVTRYGYSACCDRRTSVTDPSNAATLSAYDPFGNVLVVTDPNSNVTRMTYDGLNRLLTRTNGANETTTFTYDDNLADGVGIDAVASRVSGLALGPNAAGSGVQTTDALGHKTFELKDGAARSVRTLDGNGNATTRKYDVLVSGLVETSIVDPLLHSMRSRSDGLGNARRLVDAENRITTRTFDANSNELSLSDPNSTGYSCQFDLRNRKSSCTDTQGDTQSFGYDAENSLTSQTDALGQITRYTYDARNRKVSERDRLNGITSWAFDADSNTITMTDAQGSATNYLFDSRGLLTRETLPAQQAGVQNIRSYGYDPGRRMVSRTDQTGTITNFRFDSANRLTGRNYPDGLNDSMTYDAASRLTSATSARYNVTVTRSYDAGNRVASEVQRVDGVNYTVGYGYDAANRKTSTTYPDGSVSTRTYTDRNQLKTAKLATTLLATWTYDPGLRLTNTTLGNGLAETRTYRADNLVTSIATPGINQLTYVYDANKRVTNEANPLLPPEALSYGYDVEDRLTTFQRGPTATPAQSQSWNLSLVGDWASTTRDGVLETRTHTAVHEITSLAKTGSPTMALNHDAKGNLGLTQNGQALTWDIENRLASANPAPGLAGGQYKYDVLGRRLKKAVGSVSTVFVHDGDQVIAEYENGVLARRYVYGAYIDEPLAMVSSTGPRYYHQNQIYHVMAMTNSSGQLAERYGYTAYGKRRVVSPGGAKLAASAIGNQVGFTGRYHDGETGLTYFRARYLDAELGRFVSRDPLFEQHAVVLGPWAHNRNRGGANSRLIALPSLKPVFYPYANNSPINFVDPFGWAPGDPFYTPDAAAADWAQYYGGPSIVENKEYGSSIYHSNGEYYYTEATIGTSGRVPIPPAPEGTEPAATIHSHGAFEDADDNEYSIEDEQNAFGRQLDSYLASPDGSLQAFDPMVGTGETRPVNERGPSDPQDPSRKNSNTPPGYGEGSCNK